MEREQLDIINKLKSAALAAKVLMILRSGVNINLKMLRIKLRISHSSVCLSILLLRCGDIESNPGPPRRQPSAAPGATKAPSQEDKLARLEEKVKEYEEKIVNLEKTVKSHRSEIDGLKDLVKNLDGMEDKLIGITTKMDAITGVYDDLHEKMHEIDKTRKNNLLFYGIKPDFLPEIQTQLEQKIHEMMKVNLHISREIPCTKISRMISGPQVRGCRPVLVNFVNWKDREEVLRKATFLRGSNIYVTEDLSRKVREHRHELQKYARQVRSKSPNKKCMIRQDKLFIDNHMYVYDEDKHDVVPFARPPSPHRVPSRNYTNMDNILRRSTSVHSVNGEASMVNGDGDRSPRNAPASASVGGKYASTESLFLNHHDSHHPAGLDHNPQTDDSHDIKKEAIPESKEEEDEEQLSKQSDDNNEPSGP
eukprot:maker-scaffold335_size202896-snap-gene-1.20 protein:Tk05625 transcript:maker-scaffold335_size202896-snap-gene-1.20-mRNA-1 annotation:"sporulation-specific protein 15-like"